MSLGTPLRPQISEPIPKADDKTPGYGWRLSDAARRSIEAIERNHREAHRRAKDVWFS